jgi:transcriptional regulator of arginine metabolism
MHKVRMTELKERRQRAIADIIRTGALSSQEDLAERLCELGFAVTQATISRDLEQIGAIKVRRSGQLSYALPDQVQAATGPRLLSVLRDFARSIDTAANLVVIKTPPGTAHMIGVALDQSDVTEIVGTICGDDTIFVACGSVATAAELAGRLQAESGKLQ